jgi:predicted RND superfamily exporter protein
MLECLASLQLARPRAFLGAGLIATLVGGLLCLRLELRTRFEDLLPASSPSVVELRRLIRETEQGGQIFVLVDGAARDELRAAADDIARRLQAAGEPRLTGASSGVHEARRFLSPRAGLFASVEQLERVDAGLRDRLAWELGEVLGWNLDGAPPPVDLEQLASELSSQTSISGLRTRFPDGYYEDPAGTADVVVVRTSVASGDLPGARSALDAVERSVNETLSKSEHAGVRARYAGDLVTGLAEFGATQRDLVDVGVLGLGMVLAVVLLHFMRLRVLLLMAVAIVAGLAWTFGLTALLIGHLNLASGSLLSLVTGSSINHGIIFMARYFEERRGGRSVSDAVIISHAATGPATLTAALAGAAAYGCLVVGDFPLLDHFAVVGALGMFLCWVATLLLLAPALVCLERRWPLGEQGGARSGPFDRLRVRYEAPFLFLVSRFARPTALAGGALVVVGAIASARYARAWPTEHDMRRLQNDLGDATELYATSERCARILGATIESAMVVLADRPEQVPALKQVLEARRDAARSDEKPFEAVHTLFDFVPPQQPQKLALLASIRATLLRLEPHATSEQWQSVAPFLPPADLAPYSITDLPAEVAAPFTDKGGVRGRLALIEPTAGHSDTDLRYLLRWANAFRETRLPSGELVHGSGRAVVFADMLQAVQTATPRTLALSLCMTTLVVALLFRGARGTLLVFASLLTGLVWLGLMMSLGGVRLNFMNFIALPVTFGIAVDYPVNFLTRLRGDPARDVVAALRGSGGAIVLCSLTTLLGYTALLASVNQAIRSLGLLCVLGEIACVTAATLFLPAVLSWLRGSNSQRSGAKAGLRTAQ